MHVVGNIIGVYMYFIYKSRSGYWAVAVILHNNIDSHDWLGNKNSVLLSDGINI